LRSRSGLLAAVLASVTLVLVVLYFAREPVLFGLGKVLVHTEAPVHVDAVVVIGGDASGNRILKAAQLVKDGYAPIAIVSGAGAQYGFHESELAIELAVKHGFARETMLPLRYAAASTKDEAIADIRALRERGAHSYILVTSSSHTARAMRVFRGTAPDLEIHTVAAFQPHWNDGKWWVEREGRKAWLFEAMKTVGDFIGL
jgi:uncharacterized SAM-binding protein YcdF (DUF218 family)